MKITKFLLFNTLFSLSATAQITGFTTPVGYATLEGSPSYDGTHAAGIQLDAT